MILIVYLFVALIMSRDWGWGVHDPSRRQVLSRGMGSGPSGGSRTHPPLPLQILMILFKMFYDDWCMDVGKGLGVWSVWSVEKAGTLPVNGIGPQWGITHSSPLPLLIWGLMLFLIQLFVMIILWMFWGDWGWGMRDTPRRQILSQWMGWGPSGGLRIHPPLPPLKSP